MKTSQKPLLSGVVVHWRNEAQLAELRAAWPRDLRFELVVVDNSASAEAVDTNAEAAAEQLLVPSTNLGFAGGANLGWRAARADIVLLLNADIVPAPDSLERLLEGFGALPQTAGMVPRLLSADGASQHRWQLRPLPWPGTLLLQTLLLPAGAGPRQAPPTGTAIEQPAAAALALRRQALERVDGLDEGFFPAWFEDVDLARRLAAAGLKMRYWPAATFRHQLGASVDHLGYGPFQWIYYRNLMRYLAKHHHPLWRPLATATLVLGMTLRMLLTAVRKPARASDRGEAVRGQVGTILGALTSWRKPAELALRYGSGLRLSSSRAPRRPPETES